MAAPTVTRPLATPPDTKPAGLNVEEIARWAKWVVLACILAGLVGLIVIAVMYFTQQHHTEELRVKWDEVFTATKDKNTPKDRIQALEAVAPKVAGTPPHAFVLMELGNLYFEQAVNAKKSREERAEALDKATKLYELVATTEPFKSNDTFGPAATRAAATCYEQAGNYDAAIKLLKEEIAQPDMMNHYLYNPMVAQLGREYWLRSQAKAAKNEDPEPDRKEARAQLSEALRNVGDKNEQESWRSEAEFIKALIDKPGKALPDGKAPPEKVAAAPEKKAAEKKDGAPAAPDAKKDAAPADAKKVEEPKKADEKKADDKKDEKKPDIKKDEGKKDGSIQLPNPENDASASVPASPSGHLSFSQIQKMLKEGRPAFCNCPRCQAAQAPPSGVRLAD